MQYEEKYDVVIVGAGPGGLRCAEILGNGGKKVLIVERNELIGPKVCAGGLTRKAIEYLHGIGMPKDIVENEFDGIVFRKGRFKTRINFGETFLYTISRKNLGQWQLQKLCKMQNVTVAVGTSVTEITKEYVVLNGSDKIQYDFLVGADGSNSIVRRFLGIATKRFGIGYQYMVPSLQKSFKDVEIVFDSKSFHSWYAWIFPYTNSASIGTGYAPLIMSAKKSRKKFKQWIDKEKISIKNIQIEAHPMNGDYRGYRFGNTFLVGDAAGALSGFTGEGIYQSLIFGEEVANIILDHNHENKKIDEVLHEKKVQEVLLLLVMLSGPFRNLVFYVVILVVKIPWCGRTLLRVLS